MRRLLSRLRCLFGFHSWFGETMADETVEGRYCVACRRRQYRHRTPILQMPGFAFFSSWQDYEPDPEPRLGPEW